MELEALQEAHPEIIELDASVAAISPQEAQFAKDTAERHDLSFPTLIDEGNQVADQFGLVFQLGEDDITIFEDVLDVDLVEHNVDGSHTLPIPATYVINTDRTVRDCFVHADYTKRMEPDDVIQALRDIS